MRIKSEKGFTGVDIAIAVVVIFIFVSIIATLSYRFSSTSKELELKTEATYLAIEEIEKIKTWDFDSIKNISESSGEVIINDETIIINGATGSSVEVKEGFYKKILVKDYHDIDNSKIENLVKEITVEISYMFNGKTETVELKIIKAKGN